MFLPDSLLIRIEPVTWIGGFSVYSLLYWVLTSLICILLFWGLQWLKWWYDHRKWKRDVIGTLPIVWSPAFTWDALRYMRGILTLLYLPEHSYAHTVHDIEIYVTDPQLLHSLHHLEESLYRGQHLSSTDEESILSILSDLQNWARNIPIS